MLIGGPADGQRPDPEADPEESIRSTSEEAARGAETTGAIKDRLSGEQSDSARVVDATDFK